MRFSKSYLENKDINFETQEDTSFSGLYVIALKLLEAIDSDIDPVQAYHYISQTINSGNAEMKVFNPQHLKAFEQIKEKHAFGIPISNIIKLDNALQTQILSAYRRLKRFMEMQTDETSQPASDFSREFNSDSAKEVFSSLNKMMTDYLKSLDLMKQEFNVLYGHLQNSSAADELKADIEKIYNYLKHELSVTNESLQKGAEGVLNFSVGNSADTSAAEPATNPIDWPRKLSRSADAKTLTFSLLQNWYHTTDEFHKGIQNLWKHFFFASKDKKDISKQIMKNLSDAKSYEQKKDLWKQFSDRLNEITQSFSQGKTSYSGNNKPFDTGLLEEVHRILKWNMVKIIGDINIAKADLHRLASEDTNPLTRQVPKEEENTPINVYRVPFMPFYKQFTDNMRKVDDYLSTSMEKVQELIAQTPNVGFEPFIDILKKVDEIIGTSYVDIMSIKTQFSSKTAQEADPATISVQQLSQYTENFKANYAKVDKFFYTAYTELDRISQRPDLSPEDSEQVKQIMAVFADMLNKLREQRVALDTFIKQTKESGKPVMQKIDEFFGRETGTTEELGKKLFRWFSGRGSK